MCGCGLPLCPLPPDDNFKKANKGTKSDDCPLVELTADQVTAEYIIATNGAQYKVPPKSAIRPGETFLVDCKNNVFRPKRKHPINKRKFSKEDFVRDESIPIRNTGISGTGMSQTPYYFQRLVNDYEYEYNLYDFVYSPAVDITSKRLSGQPFLFQSHAVLTDPLEIDSLVPYDAAMSRNGRVKGLYYSINRDGMFVSELIEGHFQYTAGGGSSKPIVDVAAGEITVLPYFGPSDEPYYLVPMADLPPFPPMTESELHALDPTGLNRPIGIVTGIVGTTTASWVSPHFKRFSLETGITTEDTATETVLGGYPAGLGDFEVFWSPTTGGVVSSTEGRYTKKWEINPYGKPFPVPIIEVEVYHPVVDNKFITVFDWNDTFLHYDINLDTLLPTGFQGSSPPFIDGVFRHMLRYQTAPGPVDPIPTWTNPENYLFKSRDYGGASFTILPVTRGDDQNVSFSDYYGPVKVKVSGSRAKVKNTVTPVLGRDGLPALDIDGNPLYVQVYDLDSGGNMQYVDSDAIIYDHDGFYTFSSWTYFENEYTCALILVNMAKDELVIISDIKLLGNSFAIDELPLMKPGQLSLGNPVSAGGAFAHYDQKNNLGLVKFDYGVIKYGPYNAYHDSSGKRWSDFGVKRPTSYAKYVDLIVAGLAAGKEFYEIVPPPYIWESVAEGNRKTNVTPKDLITTDSGILCSRYLGSQPRIIVPFEVYNRKLINPPDVYDWILDSTGVDKVAKLINLPGTAIPDETDDDTGLTGVVRVRFDLSSFDTADGFVLVGRYKGDIVTDPKFRIRVSYPGGVTWSPNIIAYPAGQWNYNDTDQGADPIAQDASEYRSFVAPLEDYGFSILSLEIDISTSLSQLIILTGA